MRETVVDTEDSDVLEVDSEEEEAPICEVVEAHVWLRADEATVSHAIEVVRHAEEIARQFAYSEGQH